MVQYDVVLNFITKLNSSPISSSASKKLFNPLEKKVKEFSSMGDLKIKKGSVFDADVYSKISNNIKASTLSDFTKQVDALIPKELDTSGFDDMAKRIGETVPSAENLNKAFSKLTQIERFKVMGVDAEYLNTQVKELKTGLNLTDKQFMNMEKSARKMARGFDMSSLSLLFFGMFLQRTFLGIFNQMLNTFKMLDKKGIMPLNRALTRLEAAFTFLGFSIPHIPLIRK